MEENGSCACNPAVHDKAPAFRINGLATSAEKSLFASQKMVFFIARMNQQDLTVVGKLMATGQVTPVIDRRYRLSEAREAFRYMEDGHAHGKVIITLE